MNDIDKLAANIRKADGNHSLGAGAIAERLVEDGWIHVSSIEAAIQELTELIEKREADERWAAETDEPNFVAAASGQSKFGWQDAINIIKKHCMEK